jgi:hypothetical protein
MKAIDAPGITVTPIGSMRLWGEEFVDVCVQRINVPTIWTRIGEVNAINIKIKAPESSGIYAFVRLSRIEELAPVKSYPLIVYIGLAKDIRRRLLQYVGEKRTAFRYTAGSTKQRSGIRSMFRTYRDSLDMYFFECNEIDLVSVEDLLIKLFDPIFNEDQKISTEITESSAYLIGSISAPEPAYLEVNDSIVTGTQVLGRVSSSEAAF